MNSTNYKTELRQEFAHYGFTECPLTDCQMGILFRLGYSIGDAYGIGCDVNSGFYFDDAVRGGAVYEQHC